MIVLEATIAPDGRVMDARVTRAIPHLDQAALDAVVQWRYEPVLVNGEPTTAIAQLIVNFRLG